MKKIFLFTLFCICAPTICAQETCRLPEGVSPDRAFSVLQKKLSATAGDDLGLRHIDSDPKTGIISTETRIFKLKRHHPVVGNLPKLHRPKWRKEKIQLTATLADRVMKVSLKASAYNRRGRKWYPVVSTGRFEETVLQEAVTELLQGINGVVIGSPGAVGKDGLVTLTNLQPFTITSAYMSLRDIKSLVVDLTARDGGTYKLSIPFLGPVDNIGTALEAFFSRFTVRDLKAGVPRAYDYYWAYAIHGDIMNGMRQNQVLTALGKPDTRHLLGNDREEWVYKAGNQVRLLQFVKGELQITENMEH